MARRRPTDTGPELAPPTVPARLAVCIVGDWLPADYSTPTYRLGHDPEQSRHTDQALAAWDEWRRARAAWGREHHLTRDELADLIPMRGPRWT